MSPKFKPEASRKGVQKELKNTIEVVNVHGIELPKATNSGGAPSPSSFSDYIEDSLAVELQQRIAKAWLMDEPILLEGGTSLGKTRTVLKICSVLGYEAHKLVLSRETDRMELLGSPTINPEYGEKDNRKFIIVLSQLVKAITPEDGKIKVAILDELNSAMPGVLIRLHEILDAYKFNGGEIIFSELGGLRVKVDKTKVKFVGLMNPPGAGYSDRNAIDPANLRRWVYQKLPDELPQEVLRTSIEEVFGLGKRQAGPTQAEVQNLAYMIPDSEFENIKGLAEILPQYLTFHESIKAMVDKRQIGNEQPQRFSFDDREEPRRVKAYVARFYRGDITKVIQEALRYFYAGKILDDKEKEKLEEMIRKVEVKPMHNPNRIGFNQLKISQKERKFWANESVQSVLDIRILQGVETVEKGVILLEVGKYDDMTSEGLAAMSPYKNEDENIKTFNRDKDKIKTHTLHVGIYNPEYHLRDTKNIMKELNRLGLRPLNAHELLVLGIEYPLLLEKNMLIAVSSKKIIDGEAHFVGVGLNMDEVQATTLIDEYDKWDEDDRFPVTKK